MKIPIPSQSNGTFFAVVACFIEPLTCAPSHRALSAFVPDGSQILRVASIDLATAYYRPYLLKKIRHTVRWQSPYHGVPMQLSVGRQGRVR